MLQQLAHFTSFTVFGLQNYLAPVFHFGVFVFLELCASFSLWVIKACTHGRHEDLLAAAEPEGPVEQAEGFPPSHRAVAAGATGVGDLGCWLTHPGSRLT